MIKKAIATILFFLYLIHTSYVQAGCSPTPITSIDGKARINEWLDKWYQHLDFKISKEIKPDEQKSMTLKSNFLLNQVDTNIIFSDQTISKRIIKKDFSETHTVKNKDNFKKWHKNLYTNVIYTHSTIRVNELNSDKKNTDYLRGCFDENNNRLTLTWKAKYIVNLRAWYGVMLPKQLTAEVVYVKMVFMIPSNGIQSYEAFQTNNNPWKILEYTIKSKPF